MSKKQWCYSRPNMYDTKPHQNQRNLDPTTNIVRVQTTFGNTNALKYVKTLIMRAATYRNIFKN